MQHICRTACLIDSLAAVLFVLFTSCSLTRVPGKVGSSKRQCSSSGSQIQRHMGCCCGVSAAEAFDRLAASLPQTAGSPEDLPNVTFPPPAKRKPVGGIINDLDPDFIHQQLHVDGGLQLPLSSCPSLYTLIATGKPHLPGPSATRSSPFSWTPCLAGVVTEDDPFTDLISFAAEAPSNNPYLYGKLTATYPEVWDSRLGRMVISNHPNQGAQLD